VQRTMASLGSALFFVVVPCVLAGIIPGGSHDGTLPRHSSAWN
jgi:hypothetical protein